MKAFFILSVIVFNAIAGIAQTSFLNPGLAFGRYKVGFRAFHKYDYSRSVPDSQSIFLKTPLENLARPIQICVWYPAEVEKDTIPMPYKDYVYLMATEFDFSYQGDPMEHPFVKERVLDNPSFREEQVNAVLQATSTVFKNAPQVSGKFPVIVYSPGGFGSSFENATLFEYLASHGYIVAAYPSTPIDQPPSDQPGLGSWLFDARARDLQFVIAFMHTFPEVDMDKLALMGFSLGGASIVSVASRDIRIKAVVSIDGWHEKDILKWLPITNFKNINVPFINLVNKTNTLDAPNRIVYDSIDHNDAYYVRFNHFGHTFFGSSWILLSDHNSAEEDAVGGTQQEVDLGYNLLSHYILHFFNAYLRNDLTGLKALQTLHQRGDIPTGFLHYEQK